MPDKLALVFSGGGAKGSFSVGVLAGMVEAYPRLRWHIVTGASTGSLIAPLAALGAKDRSQITRLERVYRTARKKKILDSNLDLRHLIRFRAPAGLYNMTPLAKLIRAELPDDLLSRLAADDVATVACAVDLVTGRLVLCSQDSFAPALRSYYEQYVGQSTGQLPVEVIPFSSFREALVASSAIPFAVDPVAMDGRLLVDGGVREFAPLRPAIALGATHVIVISTVPADPLAPGTLGNLCGVGLRAVDLLEDEVMRGDLASASLAVTMRRTSSSLSRDLVAFSRVVGAGDPAASAGRASPGHRGPHSRLVEYLDSSLAELPALIAPASPLGTPFDFDSTVPAGWPSAPAPGAPKAIMDARVDYGRALAAQLISSGESLRRLLERFSA